MPRKLTSRGTPAAGLLANGLSRHGQHCSCPYCRAEYDVPVLAGIRIRDAILGALTVQQAKRDRYDCDGWIAAERKVMLGETNEWRALLGRPPIAEAAICRVERRAVGHSDYSSKFALYCAELALDTGPGAP